MLLNELYVWATVGISGQHCHHKAILQHRLHKTHEATGAELVHIAITKGADG
jgi:hypothetical protein